MKTMPKPRKTLKASEGIAPTVMLETTSGKVVSRNEKGQLLPGVRLNVAGRPKGSRHKLETCFIDALVTAFDEGGIEAIRKVRDDDPSAFLNVIAKVLPKQVETKIQVSIEELGDDELANIAAGGRLRVAETETDTPQLH